MEGAHTEVPSPKSKEHEKIEGQPVLDLAKTPKRQVALSIAHGEGAKAMLALQIREVWELARGRDVRLWDSSARAGAPMGATCGQQEPQ
mmetsp:Transcript_28068/g.65464  ORF Transcript_28068/g.65464 Transcript_28068/m.65464 type:complete len:89 (+) Transcript_28068:110-376(+)